MVYTVRLSNEYLTLKTITRVFDNFRYHMTYEFDNSNLNRLWSIHAHIQNLNVWHLLSVMRILNSLLIYILAIFSTFIQSEWGFIAKSCKLQLFLINQFYAGANWATRVWYRKLINGTYHHGRLIMNFIKCMPCTPRHSIITVQGQSIHHTIALKPRTEIALLWREPQRCKPFMTVLRIACYSPIRVSSALSEAWTLNRNCLINWSRD